MKNICVLNPSQIRAVQSKCEHYEHEINSISFNYDNLVQLRQLSVSESPREICGVIIGFINNSQAYVTRTKDLPNRKRSPYHFGIHLSDFLNIPLGTEESVLGIYHSHKCRHQLSPKDRLSYINSGIIMTVLVSNISLRNDLSMFAHSYFLSKGITKTLYTTIYKED